MIPWPVASSLRPSSTTLVLLLQAHQLMSRVYQLHPFPVKVSENAQPMVQMMALLAHLQESCAYPAKRRTQRSTSPLKVTTCHLTASSHQDRLQKRRTSCTRPAGWLQQAPLEEEPWKRCLKSQTLLDNYNRAKAHLHQMMIVIGSQTYLEVIATTVHQVVALDRRLLLMLFQSLTPKKMWTVWSVTLWDLRILLFPLKLNTPTPPERTSTLLGVCQPLVWWSTMVSLEKTPTHSTQLRMASALPQPTALKKLTCAWVTPKWPVVSITTLPLPAQLTQHGTTTPLVYKSKRLMYLPPLETLGMSNHTELFSVSLKMESQSMVHTTTTWKSTETAMLIFAMVEWSMDTIPMSPLSSILMSWVATAQATTHHTPSNAPPTAENAV